MSGVFAVSRDVFDHPSFARQPFTEREAWIWLIAEAVWKDRTVRVGRAVIDLKRGQCAFSTRFLASKWQWSEATVRRFLKRLENDAMVVVKADALATQVTICKYNEYQRVSLPRDAPNDALGDALVTHSRRKEESTEYTEDKKEPLRGASPEAELFALGRKVLGKSAGGVVTQLRKAADFDDVQVKALIEEAATKADPGEWIGGVLKRHKAESYGLPVVAPNVPRIRSREDREWDEAEKLIYRNVL
jgi:hypothetical protein